MLNELQVLELAASRLQFDDFLLQLVEQLHGSPLSFFLPLLELFDQLSLLYLNGCHKQIADLSAALNLSLCDFLLIETTDHVNLLIENRQTVEVNSF